MGEFTWDGRYFVTLLLPGGRVVRRDAARPLPPRYTVIMTDNGMQGLAWVRARMAELRREYAGEGRR